MSCVSKHCLVPLFDAFFRSNAANAAKHGGLMRSSDVKIGAIGPDGKTIETNSEVKRIRSYIQTCTKLLREGKPIPPYGSTEPAKPNESAQAEPAKPSGSASAAPNSSQPAPKAPQSTEKNKKNTAPQAKAKPENPTGTSSSHRLQFDDPKKVSEFEKKSVIFREKMLKQHPLFTHIAQYERATAAEIYEGARRGGIHSAVLSLGHAYASGIISGTTARTMALADALLELIGDYQTPKDAVFSRTFPAVLQSHIRFIIDCRQMAIPMGNLVRYVKRVISTLTDVPEAEARSILLQKLTELRLERIELATRVLATHGSRRIVDGDVVLVYAFSRAVESVLLAAHKDGKRFSVIVVDSKPLLEGKQLLERLVLQGLDCKYSLLHSAGYIMRSVTKVILGASAMFANGSLLARTGSAMIAMIAETSRVPVLVCCETFKFSDRVQLDSICGNEIGSPDELLGKGSAPNSALNPLETLCQAGLIASASADNGGNMLISGTAPEPSVVDWRNTKNLQLLNIAYDVTPMHFISCVVTEMGVVPPTSVAVILREFNDVGF